MTAKLIRFPGARGQELVGRLEQPTGAPRAYALFAHCFTCSKESKAAALVSRALASQGIAVLRFDFTGLGQSGGEFSDTSLSSNIEDIVAAARFLEANYAAVQLLIGHSLGGAAVLAAAAQVTSARAVATIASPYDPRHVERLITNREEVASRGEAEVDIGGRPFRMRASFLEDLERHDPAAAIATLGKALLILHSPRDTVVDIGNAAQVFAAAKHPKSFISLDDADHLLTRAEDAQYAAQVLSAWASRYLAVEPDKPADGVRVVEAHDGRFAQDVYAGRHRLRADEPVSVGGRDSGPNPYDLLLAALGACTAMTLRLYADHKRLALERVEVSLVHRRVHAADCEQCETANAKLEQIERVVKLEGQLSDDERGKLAEIADKCPVHRTLQQKVAIVTRLAE